jgi:hypothetical protein
VNETKPVPPSTQVVPFGRTFKLLVADDPTYKAGTPIAPVPWDGLFRIHLSGPCVLSTTPDSNDGDVPPGYSDDQQRGAGPYAQFDITPTGHGPCTITISEDPAYVTDQSNATNPTGRSASLTVTIL